MKLVEAIKNNKKTEWIWRLAWRLKLSKDCFVFNFKKGLRQCGLYDPDFSELKSIKNKYEGERCFIIATGPSLRSEDILSLKNEYTFSMNAMCLKYDELNWTPDFYIIQDVNVFHKLKPHIDNDRIKYIFVDGRHKHESKQYKRWVYFPRLSAYNSYDAFLNKQYHVKFSDDIHAVVYDGFTVTYSAIQFAVYMGFKEIYLLGCDCGYSKDKSKRYFADHGVESVFFDDLTERMLSAYRVAKEYADKNSIKVFNATRGGRLEVFQRIDFDTIPKKEFSSK